MFKFHEEEDRCIRGGMCEYLHNKLPKQNDNIADVLATDKEVEIELESKATQTDDMIKKCVCRKEVVKNEFIMENTMICLFKRVQCDQDKWEEIDDAVYDSENYLEEMLDQCLTTRHRRESPLMNC